MFLAIDAVLMLYQNVAAGLVVHPAVVRRHLDDELPFLASETLLMEAVKSGADRQDAHEALRVASRTASEAIHKGEQNPMRELLALDPCFGSVAGRLDELLDGARHVGRAPDQVLEFVAAEVDPLLDRLGDLPPAEADIRV